MDDIQPTPNRVPERVPRDRRPSLALVFLFWGIIAFKLYITRLIVLGDSNLLRALVLEGGFALLLVSVAALLPRGRFWVWLAIDGIVSVICIAMVVYVRQFEQIATIGTLGLSRELLGVREAVGVLLRPVYLLFFVDIPLLAALFLAARPQSTVGRTHSPQPSRTAERGQARERGPVRDAHRTGGRPTAQRRLDRRLVIMTGVAALWVALPIVSLALSAPADDSIAGARARGLLAYAIYDPQESEAGRSEADIEREVAQAAASNMGGASASSSGTTKTANGSNVVLGDVDLHSPAAVQKAFVDLQGGANDTRLSGAPRTGIAKGRSVIVVQVESLSTWTTIARIGDRQVTPNFNRLVGESWYVPKMITQIGRGNTSDAEFTTNTSLLADRSKPSAYVWGDKKLPSLPRLVRNLGYVALTFHTNHISYWRRNLLYPALGFSKWYSKPDFPNTDIIDGIGASDRVLYQKVAQVLETRHAKQTPYLAEVLTLAAHSPYLGASKRSTLECPSSVRGTTLEDYLRAINYEDAELGTFIDRLKRDGIWDEAVVVVFGDHFGVRPVGGSSIPVSKREEKAIADMLGRKPTWADTYEVPFLIHLPGQTDARLIDGVRAQADVMPTIADVLGLDLSATPHMGTTVFDTRPRTVVMRHYVPNATFVTDEYIFRPGAGYNDAKVSRLDGSGYGNLPLATVPKTLYERIKTLTALNQLYLKSLPDR